MPLYYAPGWSSMAPHLVLEEAGAEYDLKFLHEDAGEQRSEAYLRINPRCKVPALQLADGTVLVENTAIRRSGRNHYAAQKRADADIRKGACRSLSRHRGPRWRRNSLEDARSPCSGRPNRDLPRAIVLDAGGAQTGQTVLINQSLPREEFF